MINKEFSNAIKKVYAKLSDLSEEDFNKKLKEHEDGDFARILLETGALEIGEIKANIYDGIPWEDTGEKLIPTFSGSLYFDINGIVNAPSIFSGSLSLFQAIPSLVAAQKTLADYVNSNYSYNNISIPDISTVNFGQYLLWQLSSERIDTKEMLLNSKIFNTTEPTIIAVNEEEEVYKWAA